MSLWRISLVTAAILATVPAAAGAASREQVVARALEGVATVESGSSIGTAFAIDGAILTNAHVVDGASTVRLRNSAGDEAEARVAMRDSARDVARLESDLPLRPLHAAPSPAQAGQDVLVIGTPSGLSGTVTRGIVSATERSVNGVPMIQSDAAANPGSSGGPMLDSQGRVLGMTTAKREAAEGIAFAIPIDLALATATGAGAGEAADEGGGPGLLWGVGGLLVLALLTFAGLRTLRRRSAGAEPAGWTSPPSATAPQSPPDEDPVIVVHTDPVVVRRRQESGNRK